MTYRVIQWSTGNVGRYALRGIIGHPELELAGVWVHSESKAGRDAAELCGLDEPTGVTATNDADALLESDADAVCYTATADLRINEAIEDLARILRAGKNVVSSSVVPLVMPEGAEPAFVDPIREACEEGGASFFTSGIDPGFANDLVPLAIASACERVDELRIMEILNYDTYDQPEVLFETMGFGKAESETPLLLLPGMLGLAWGGTLRALAAGLGAEIDDIRETYERRTTDETFEVSAGKVEAGTVAALRFEVAGMVGGEPLVVVEHVTRLRDDVAPDWPQPVGGGCYRILVEGSPKVHCDLQLTGEEDGDHNTGGLVATGLRIVNAIPAVCEAPPGMLSVLDVPLARPPVRSA